MKFSPLVVVGDGLARQFTTVSAKTTHGGKGLLISRVKLSGLNEKRVHAVHEPFFEVSLSDFADL
jgi:hypothetical protein